MTSCGSGLPPLLSLPRQAHEGRRARPIPLCGNHGFDPLGPAGDPRARGADAGEILLRLAEMRFELARPLDDEADVVEELAKLGLDLVRFVAHPRVAQDRLG